MASCLSLHSQLSSIMETLARSALSQVCTLVDEDSSELRLELSRLLLANSALAEKVNNLECELTMVISDSPKLCKSYRTVGVQTVCHKDGDAPVFGPPTIEGIFGKDWCMNLWKDRDPYSLERVTDSIQSPDKSDQATVIDIKEEDYVDDAASTSQEETLSRDEHEECLAEEQHSTCSLSFDQDEEQIVSAGGLEEQSMQLISVNDTEEAFSTHIIPIEDEEEEEEEKEEEEEEKEKEEEEEDDDDDDVQFVQESHQEPTINAATGPIQNEQQTVTANLENCTALDKDSLNNFTVLDAQTNRDPNNEKFTCKICSRAFFHKGTLTRHLKSHKSNFCSICKQHFPRRNTFNTHTCVPPVLSQRVSKSCELCGKTFAKLSSLKIHYVVHTGEKPHRCNFCEKRFTQKGNLKCHLRIHTGERPFLCVKCGKTFTQKVNLNHHLVAHINREVEGEKPIARGHLRKLMAEALQ